MPHQKKGEYSSLYVKCLAVGINLSWCKHHHKGLTVHVINVLPPSTGQKSPIIEDYWFGNVVDQIYTVDYQEEMEHVDPNLPFGAFLNRMDEKIAEIVKRGRQAGYTGCIITMHLLIFARVPLCHTLAHSYTIFAAFLIFTNSCARHVSGK